MGLLLSTGLSVGSFLATQAACCFTSAACRCVGAISCESSKATRAAYSVLFFSNSVLSWFMLSDFAGKKLAKWTSGYLKLDCKECYGMLAVQRLCFAMALFHLAMALLTMGVKSSRDRRAGFQNGFWGPKSILWIGLIVASFFIPNEFFIGYSNYVALIGAALFVLLQLMLLIDFAHTFSENLLIKYEETESRGPVILLVGTTCGLLALTITLTGILYGFFAAAPCKLNQFLISFNLILCFIACVVAVSPQVQEQNSRSGLVQVSIVTAYATYLITSAIANEPIDDTNTTVCNPIAATASSQTLSVVLGAIFTFIAINYSTSTAAVQSDRIMGTAESAGPDDVEATVPLLAASAPAAPTQDPQAVAAIKAAVESGALPQSALTAIQQPASQQAGPAVVVVHAGPSELYPTDDEAHGVAYSYSFFHVIFVLASMYVAMLLTDWNHVTVVSSAPTDADGLLVQIGKSWAAVWVKVVSSWIVIALYAWTLLAPILLPDREWH